MPFSYSVCLFPSFPVRGNIALSRGPEAMAEVTSPEIWVARVSRCLSAVIALGVLFVKNTYASYLFKE